MAWSKSTRICVMMVLDTIFLIVELTVGYWVSSLALIADAFHMLNDIISLAVGLWAVILARKETTDQYSYGWLRAEILGAFFNATFLIGLCLTIVLEALQRFFNPPEITNPEVILIVGCMGLLSNLAGFWVLGGHGHAHGHGEGEEEALEDAHDDDSCHNEQSEAERGFARARKRDEPQLGGGDGTAEAGEDQAAAPGTEPGRHITFTHVDGFRDDVRPDTLERSGSRASARSRGGRGRASSLRRNRLTSIEDISIHPSSFRQEIQEIIAASRAPDIEEEGDSDESSTENATPEEEVEPTETTPLVDAEANGAHDHKPSRRPHEAPSRSRSRARGRRGSGVHDRHHHNMPKELKKGGSHGHGHGDMGMNAMVLHVLGDALGNVGVIITALIIWKTTSPYRFYADPIVSLLITIIILKSAIPLTKATSKILLQATPDHINLNDIREDIQDLPGVLSCHHIHVWQLSDTKIVASMHIEVAFPISEEGGEKYMALAKRVRKCLHAYGIHSATIQPEFRLDDEASHGGASGSNSGGLRYDGPGMLINMAPGKGQQGCLLECVDDCVAQGCCTISSRTASPPASSGSGHGHDHDHDHYHDHDHDHDH